MESNKRMNDDSSDEQIETTKNYSDLKEYEDDYDVAFSENEEVEIYGENETSLELLEVDDGNENENANQNNFINGDSTSSISNDKPVNAKKSHSMSRKLLRTPKCAR